MPGKTLIPSQLGVNPTATQEAAIKLAAIAVPPDSFVVGDPDDSEDDNLPTGEEGQGTGEGEDRTGADALEALTGVFDQGGVTLPPPQSPPATGGASNPSFPIGVQASNLLRSQQVRPQSNPLQQFLASILR